MFTLICDRPRFFRATKGSSAVAAEKIFSCPVTAREEGQICPLTPEPCAVYIAKPFDDFPSIAAKTGREAARLAAFNGGVVWPCRKIYLY